MSYRSPCKPESAHTKVKKVRKKLISKTKNAKEPKETQEKNDLLFSIRSMTMFHMDNRGLCLNEDCDSEPDRSNPQWKICEEESSEESIKETESDSIQHKLSLWDEIMLEYEDKRQEYKSLLALSQPYEPELPLKSKLSATQYLEKHIFPLLYPVLIETLFQAKKWECLLIQKCRFNGLDYIAELMWNRNPLHPRRKGKYREIFDIPFVIIWLYHHPRPIYPLSWLWTKEEAVTVLQAYIRRYLVCRETECSEMRQFWKTLRNEKEEEKINKREKSIEQLEALFNDIFDKLVADAVFKSEWKIHGCRCIKKPCHCICRCQNWCKCCDCYKVSGHDALPCDCPSLWKELN